MNAGPSGLDSWGWGETRIWTKGEPGQELLLLGTLTASPLPWAYLWATARSVKPSTGRLAKQFPRSRRSLTHSRGGKRSSSLLGGVQSRYTACRTSSSKDRTSFSSASESPCLQEGRMENTPVSPARGRRRHKGIGGHGQLAAQCPAHHPEDQHLDMPRPSGHQRLVPSVPVT